MQKLAVLNTHPIQYFAPLYRRLAQEPSIDLTVYFCSRQGADEYLDEGFGQRVKWDTSLLDGYRHKFLKNLRRRDAVEGFWSLINPEIISELRHNRYDALWINGHNHASYLIAILAAKALGIRVLMRCDTHLLLRRSALKRAIRKPLMGVLYNQMCAGCMSVGTRNREFYLGLGVAEDKLFTVPFAVDNDFFIHAAQQHNKEESRRQLGLPVKKPVILFASKLTKQKRPSDLLRAFARVREGGHDAALIFVGSGSEEQPLRNLMSDLNVPDVYFFGFRNQSELPEFYATADIFVLPSARESWGLVLNEAMCAALPLIASEEIGAVPDLVQHERNGFAFEAGNIEELSGYLSKLVDNSELRNRMGAESLRIIQLWDYEACVRGIKNALAPATSACEPLSEGKAA